MLRIYSDRLYIVALPQGISGFPRPSIPGIVSGHKKRRDRLPNWVGSLPMVSTATFRMNDGHLSCSQPCGGIDAVTAFLKANPWSEAIYVKT